ncbi:hypothetical protein E2C01_044350 [Portunus trituberculatus]|uniref:Uncharacterized protein n=1 Tax=Portunus trituberculatus TaxID=210409 RepID=A0A5B7FSW7_PORTR|nr:hypothetical protein [Portunus trituberculatus]
MGVEGQGQLHEEEEEEEEEEEREERCDNGPVAVPPLPNPPFLLPHPQVRSNTVRQDGEGHAGRARHMLTLNKIR